MDSIIAKLDGSVFGMLIEQPPHILITGIQKEDLEFIDRVRPDFICLENKALKKEVCPVVRVIDSPDDLPVISGTDDPRAINIRTDAPPDKAVKLIQDSRPDTVILALEDHNEDEYSMVRRLIRAVRSIQPEMTD